MNEIILTHCGKLGDFLYSLMVGSWLFKNYQRKIHWVLPRSFGPFRYIENLLMAQEQTSRVTLVDHEIKNFDCGGQPYKFDPMRFGIMGEYFNLGFRGYPDKFVPAFYAEEYGLRFDPDFTLNLGTEAFESGLVDWSQKILRSCELAMQMHLPEVESIATQMDLLDLARKLATAKEFHTWYNGIAILCWLARIPAHVYRVPGHARLEQYFPDLRSLTIHELAVHPKEMVQP
jgi:hypothetical protein